MTESQVVNGWISQGHHKGRLEQAQFSLLELLRGRFAHNFTPEMELLVTQQTDVQLLNDWFRVAVRAFSYDQFLQHLRR